MRRRDDRADQLGHGFAGRFFGVPGAVADAILELGELGVARLSLSPVDPCSLDRLAPFLMR